MKAEEITKGSTLLATLNEDNFPFGQHKDLIDELHRMINIALNIPDVSNPVCFECGEEINPDTIFFCTKCDVNNQIKANELRLGNYVKFKNDDKSPVLRIKTLGDRMCIFGIVGVDNFPKNTALYENLAGIPLTEQWLKEFGFEMNENYNWYKGVYRVSIDELKQWYFFIADYLDMPPAVEIEYVHQLQNLYFALTGKELVK